MVSVIVPVGFEYDELEDFLKSFLNKESKGYEILVGIDSGDIKNIKIVNKYKNKLPVEYFIWSEPGYYCMHEKSNMLASHARGSYVWWLSDECRMITKDWVRRIKEETRGRPLVAHPITEPADGSKHPLVSREWIRITGRFAGFPSIDSWINTVRERSNARWKQINVRVEEVERDPEQTVRGKRMGSNEFWQTKEVEDEINEDAKKLKQYAKR